MINKNSPDEYWDSIREKILGLIEKHHRPANEVILDDVDLRNLLKISRRTSLKYRDNDVYKYYKIDGKIFYILAEVIEGIKKTGGHERN